MENVTKHNWEIEGEKRNKCESKYFKWDIQIQIVLVPWIFLMRLLHCIFIEEWDRILNISLWFYHKFSINAYLFIHLMGPTTSYAKILTETVTIYFNASNKYKVFLFIFRLYSSHKHQYLDDTEKLEINWVQILYIKKEKERKERKKNLYWMRFNQAT